MVLKSSYPFSKIKKPKKDETDQQFDEKEEKFYNIFCRNLQMCSTKPMTGFLRDGYCKSNIFDPGVHTICAQLTEEFLNHQKSIGNDLTTPYPEFGFPGLKPGNRWCVTARNWKKAFDDGKAAPIDLEATELLTLKFATMQQLLLKKIDPVFEQTIVIKK